MAKMTESEARVKVENKVKEEVPDAKELTLRKSIGNFVQSSVYYVEFASKEYEPADSFFYALVEKTGEVRLYDDSTDTVEKLEDILDRRRSISQRLSEFSLNQLIAAGIALSVTLAFVILTVTERALPQEFTGIFGIIAGYYFGKNVGSDS